MKNLAFFSGAIILVIFNLVGKLVGSFYRISLAGILGGTGMGQYQLVFPLYCLILTVSTSGVPVAISKLVAEYNEQKRTRDANKILKISLVILFFVSVASSALLVFGAKFFVKLQGGTLAYYCYYAIAPAIVFVAILSALRGYFQGCLRMLPTAVSGLIEQVGKLVIGLFLAVKLSAYGIELAVFGALVGVSASELLALIFLCFCYLFRSKSYRAVHGEESSSAKFLGKSLISLAAPVTLGGLISPLTAMLDSFLVVNLLMLRGNSGAHATMLLGIQSGVIEPLVNLPVSIAVSLAVVVLPSISKLSISGKSDDIRQVVTKTFNLTLSISVCCGVCYCIFGRQMLEFLYGRNFNPEELMIATKLLFLASFNIIFLSLVQISSSVLQGLGESKFAVKSLLVGCAVKLVVEVPLLLAPGVGIFGAVISGAVCHVTLFLINYHKISKLTNAHIAEGYYPISIQACLVCVAAFFGNMVCIRFFSPVVSMFLAGALSVLLFGVTCFVIFFRKKPAAVAAAPEENTSQIT